MVAAVVSNPNRPPHRTLSEELAELERTDPAVRRASLAYDVAVARILGCKHLIPCVGASCVQTAPQVDNDGHPTAGLHFGRSES